MKESSFVAWNTYVYSMNTYWPELIKVLLKFIHFILWTFFIHRTKGLRFIYSDLGFRKKFMLQGLVTDLYRDKNSIEKKYFLECEQYNIFLSQENFSWLKKIKFLHSSVFSWDKKNSLGSRKIVLSVLREYFLHLILIFFLYLTDRGIQSKSESNTRKKIYGKNYHTCRELEDKR